MKLLISLMAVTLLLTGCTALPSDSAETDASIEGTPDGKKSAWEASPLFDLAPPDERSYQVFGIPGKVAVRGSETLEAGSLAKYLWFFWTDRTSEEKVKVVGVKEGSREPIDLIPPTSLTSPLYGADATLPSTLTLPTAGMWRLDVYFGEQLFESIYVKAI